MNSNRSEKFGFSFHLAILFHLWILALLVWSFELNNKSEPAIEPMRATILEAAPVETQGQNNKNTSSLKKDLAISKKQALRAEQMEEKKLLSAAAQKLLMLALQEEQLKQRIDGNIKAVWIRPQGTKGLGCVVRVQLDEKGRIKSTKLERSSGNPVFDESAIKAVYAVGSVAIPTNQELRKVVLDSFPISFGNA